MNRNLAMITLLVKEYDEAITFFTSQLGFELLEDTALDEKKRWVVVKPKGKAQAAILLAKADSPEQEKAIGNQSGGRIFLFLYTDNFWRDYSWMRQNGIVFNEEPRTESYGTVAVFKDLYGNLWDLLEPK